MGFAAPQEVPGDAGGSEAGVVLVILGVIALVGACTGLSDGRDGRELALRAGGRAARVVLQHRPPGSCDSN